MAVSETNWKIQWNIWHFNPWKLMSISGYPAQRSRTSRVGGARAGQSWSPDLSSEDGLRVSVKMCQTSYCQYRLVVCNCHHFRSYLCVFLLSLIMCSRIIYWVLFFIFCIIGKWCVKNRWFPPLSQLSQQLFFVFGSLTIKLLLQHFTAISLHRKTGAVKWGMGEIRLG